MKRLLIALAILLGFFLGELAVPAPHAQIDTSGLEAFASETITVTSTPVGFTLATISPANAPVAKAAECTVETNSVRWFDDGINAPSTSAGLLWPTTTVHPYTITGTNNVLRWRGAATTSTTKLTCTYLR